MKFMFQFYDLFKQMFYESDVMIYSAPFAALNYITNYILTSS